ncbi:hypothetical protein BV898_13634 [Hypsibius exemplaris]|uniref:Chromo domain-containing protein n=1 Tax=Hypsibius exemplaris TaxID=2072580 RepID=A0A1W0WA44_HYPEX|nr:hypothetical protein BV898_13634 [Hypsibius exemplaris]
MQVHLLLRRIAFKYHFHITHKLFPAPGLDSLSKKMPRKSKQSPSEKGTVMEGVSPRKRARRTRPPHSAPKVGHVEGTQHWVAESILDYRLAPANVALARGEDQSTITGKKMVYFVVKWWGYGEDELTLEPATNLASALKMVHKFLKEKGFQLAVNSETEETWLEPFVAKENDGQEEGEEEEDN